MVGASWMGIALLGQVACGEDDPSSEPAPTEGVCEQLAQLYCDGALACGCFDEPEAGRQACEELARLSCSQRSQDHVDEGDQAWDEAAVAACLSAARSAYTDCDPEVDMEAACGELTYGLVLAGGACEGTDDCADELRCIGDVCAAPIAAGEPCPTGSGCESQHYCGEEGLCRPCEPIDAACEQPGFGTCCAEPLYCEPATSTCQPTPAPLAVGASCVPYSSVPPYCEPGLHCSSVSDTCQPTPAEGDPCEHPDMLADCASGLYCAADGVCRPPLRTGDPCATDESCASRHCIGGACDPSLCPHG